MQQEPILQENKNRFVIFPINMTTSGSGTRSKKHLFGQRKKLIYTKMLWIGKSSQTMSVIS